MNEYSTRLYRPLNELFGSTFQDQATNSTFTLKSLLFDDKKKVEDPKNALDAAARHYVLHGTFPEKKEEPTHDEGHETIKEDYNMSIYSAHLYRPQSIQESGGKCTCGKADCPSCNPKKKGLKESVFGGSLKSQLFRLGEAEGNTTGIAQGTGLGTPSSTANHLYQIPINQYQASDADFVGDGESKETSQTNIPALLAAKNAGGQPHPSTISNGINKRAGGGGFKLKPLKDDLGPNG